MTSKHSSSSPHSSSHSNTTSIPSFSAKSHSVSVGSTFRTSIPSNEQDALKQITNAVNDVRRAMHSPSKTSDASVPASWTQANMNTLLSYTEGTTYPAKYQWGTSSINIASSGSGHGNSSLTNNSLSPLGSQSYHSNSAAASYHCNDTVTRAAAVSAKTDSYSNGNVGSFSTTNATTIINALNGRMLQQTSIPSFGTYTASGHNNHGNHTSHSSDN